MSEYEKVYRIEDISHCFDDMSTQTGHYIDPVSLNRKQSTLALDDLSDETQAGLARYLAQDYAELTRWYDNPLA